MHETALTNHTCLLFAIQEAMKLKPKISSVNRHRRKSQKNGRQTEHPLKKGPGEQHEDELVFFIGTICYCPSRSHRTTLTWLQNEVIRPIWYWWYFSDGCFSSYFFFTLSWPRVMHLISVCGDRFKSSCLVLIYVSITPNTHLLQFVVLNILHSRWK